MFGEVFDEVFGGVFGGMFGEVFQALVHPQIEMLHQVTMALADVRGDVYGV